MKTLLTGLILVALCETSVADENTLKQMPAIAKWAGPFGGTIITKYADYSEGVACYVYTPLSVSKSDRFDMAGPHVQFNGSIGTISCVKVIDTSSKKK